MKALYILFIAVSLSAFSMVGYGQSKDTIVKNIKSSFQQINNDKSLKIIKLENDDFQHQATDGGEELIGYFKGDTIYKMIVSIGLSFGMRDFEYYFKNGQLIFIYEKEQDFPADNSGTLNHKKLDISFEGRYYLNNGKLVDLNVKGKKRFGEKPTINSLRDILPEMKILQSHLKAKK